MKTILVSDIGNRKETIIPYALNFTKYISDTIEIVHVVDPDKQQVFASAHADSQSFDIGRKLNKKEILEREKNTARLKLDKLLSYEASRLNFPLRVNTIVEESSIKARLNKEIGKEDSLVMISAAELEGKTFHSIGEFLNITKKFNSLSLVIPPGQKFAFPKKATIIYDYRSGDKNGIFSVMESLKQFDMTLNIIAIIEDDQNTEVALDDDAWQSIKRYYTKASLKITTHLLGAKSFMQTILDYVRQHQMDMVAIPKNTRKSTGLISYPRYVSEKLIEAIDLPVILY